MPQYELEGVGPARFTGLERGRTAEDAARRAGTIPDDQPVEVGEPEGPQSWQAVAVGGVPAGRLRLHQRMRFRRD